MTTAGELRERITFAARQSADDGYGGTIGGFADRFTVAARVRTLKGGEQVMASRLQGLQPVIITVRYSDDTKQIAADWQARDARSGKIYAITAPPANTDERKGYLDILATEGAPA
jgi:SPP1 family predicted phage head-tail adaptor